MDSLLYALQVENRSGIIFLALLIGKLTRVVRQLYERPQQHITINVLVIVEGGER